MTQAFSLQESSDPIVKGVFPQCDARYELGLRSDGVVVWRLADPAISVLRR